MRERAFRKLSTFYKYWLNFDQKNWSQFGLNDYDQQQPSGTACLPPRKKHVLMVFYASHCRNIRFSLSGNFTWLFVFAHLAPLMTARIGLGLPQPWVRLIMNGKRMITVFSGMRTCRNVEAQITIISKICYFGDSWTLKCVPHFLNNFSAFLTFSWILFLEFGNGDWFPFAVPQFLPLDKFLPALTHHLYLK